MKVIHLLSGGNIGGIETLCRDYIQLSNHSNTVVFLWTGGQVADEMIQAGADVICLNWEKKNIISLVGKIKDICLQKQADVVIAHHADPFSHFCLIRLKKYLKNINTIAYSHGNAVDMTAGKNNIIRFIKRRIIGYSLKKSDRVVAISKSVADSLVSFFKISGDKITTIYNGVNIDSFQPKSSGNRSCKLIYIGRLIKQKGVQITLKALAQLNDLDFHFKIVGDGTYRTILESLTKELGIEDKVEFLGSRRDVPELLQQSDIFIHMPVWEEGFGITIIEAMAVGLPCICAHAGAIPEIIDDGENGYIVEKGNSNELSHKIREVINLNQDEKQRISANAVEKASNFSIRRYTANLDNLIESL